jgi:hypothetical protein
VLEPASDYNGDGTINRYDDDLMRNDVKNLARSDVAVHVHNNASPNPAGHGTSVYTDPDRTWRSQAVDLATLMVDAEIAALTPYTSPAYTPKRSGVKFGWYYYMGPYDPPYLPRPSLVTSVLSESLFITNPQEREMLKRDDVRTSLAASIYVGLARWLNTRALGIGYQLLSGPPGSVSVGGEATYRIRITNRGNQPGNGWKLQLHSVPQVPLYDGSDAVGSLMGEIAVPDGLQPGASVDLQIEADAPSSAGDWLVKADVQLPGGGYASTSGVVALQTGLTTANP